MRGTCAVIVMVLLVVLAAHMQREESERGSEEYTPQAMASRPHGGCESTPADAEADIDSPPSAVANAGDLRDAN